jgi:hypothetical protein
MSADRQRRVADNESLFRDVNERIGETVAHFGVGDQAMFLCECGHADCTLPVELTLDEYEAVRAAGARFLVLPGHEIEDVDAVVERHSRYFVVEKVPGPGRKVAEERDPRADDQPSSPSQ